MILDEGDRVLAAVLVAGLALGGAWVYLKYVRPATVGAGSSAPADASPAALNLTPANAPAPYPLDQSDEPLRGEAKQLMIGPKAEGWLKEANIVRRITAATAILAEGNSPRDSLAFLAPQKPFQTFRRDGKTYVDPKSYARYDGVADSIASLNDQEGVKMFRRLMPLFQTAYRELENPKADFQTAFLNATNQLLRVPIVDGDIEVRRKVTTYALADERLEKLTPAQKHLLRMGPKNVQKIQDKLRTISLGLGVPQDRLAAPIDLAPAP
ncbi:MAG: DUF3014 domain-containing protein [Elusimicrobia bacterium]|nr:DUF3014 domain-containing protein [Elusimicrobiota bacterium]